MIVSTEAIILNNKKYGDSSSIVQLFTRDFGRLSVLAKGSRSTKSKFGSAIQPLSYSMMTFYKNSQRDLHVLSNAEHLLMFNKLQQSYEDMGAGLMILESVHQCLPENEENSQLFAYLVMILKELNNTAGNPYSLFTAFQIELAQSMGLKLNFSLPLSSNKTDGNLKDYIFSLENGELSNHGESNGKFSFRFDNDTYKTLAVLMDSPFEQITKVVMDDKCKIQIHDFFVNYFSYHLEKHFTYRAYSLLNITR